MEGSEGPWIGITLQMNGDPHAPVALPASINWIASRVGLRDVLDVSEEEMNPLTLPETRDTRSDVYRGYLQHHQHQIALGLTAVSIFLRLSSFFLVLIKSTSGLVPKMQGKN